MSKVLDLNNCFPVGRNGVREPLPKQRLFLDTALSEHKAKYIRYSGGVGSGKTLIGCITVLHWAVLHPGDYLIARQFMPELKDTTYKTFLEVCPPELIAEVRVADMVVKVHTAVKGKTSTILFRGLEEPDKLRSLNLSGFYIDEAAQVSEVAFMLLQGRLRGPGLRKGIVTQNPGGHDWAWRWFVKQDHIQNLEVKKLFLNIRAPSLENIHLPDGYIDTMMATWSEERIKREIMGSDDTFEGQIYNEFDRSIHVVKPFRIPDDWTIRIGMDDGYRNHAAWVYGAINPDGDLYIFDEFYEKEWLIEEICQKGKDGRPSAIKKLGNRKVEQARMDTAAKQVKNGISNWQIYLKYLPKHFPMLEAQKSVQTGIERVKSYLKPDSRGKPRLYVFDTCVNLLDEIAQYRWAEHQVGRQGKVNEKEEPVKNNDHACFSSDTLVITSTGNKQIKDIAPGELVLTRLGFLPVLASGITGHQELVEYTLNDGRSLTSTATHPIFNVDGSIELIGAATKPLMEEQWLKQSRLTALHLGKLATTIGQTAQNVAEALNLCTEKFGRPITDLFQKVTTYITKTTTQIITTFPTLSLCPQPNIFQSTLKQTIGFTRNAEKRTWPQLDRLLVNGTPHQLGTSGINNTHLKLLKRCIVPLTWLLSLVTFAQKSMKFIRLLPSAPGSATQIAKQRIVGTSNVYNLTVRYLPEFILANGLVVHNCDALRYLVMTMPEPGASKKDLPAYLKERTMESALYRELQNFKKPKPKDPFGGY